MIVAIMYEKHYEISLEIEFKYFCEYRLEFWFVN